MIKKLNLYIQVKANIKALDSLRGSVSPISSEAERKVRKEVYAELKRDF